MESEEIEETEEVGELEEVAIFPLATVLFPGTLLPLHIFEDRYKAMIRFAIDNGRVFGLSYRSDAQVGKETPPSVGSIGCAAKIDAVIPLEEGRMNILSTGVVRYRILEIKQTVPFLIARVAPFSDDPEPDADLTRLYNDTKEVSEKFLEAVRELNENELSGNVTLPDEPEALSLFMASTLPVDNNAKQRLLELTSTRVRLSRVRHQLLEAMSEYGERLRVHERAKRNGHGKLH
ncbi:MAG TPA: LON peptidase substrate-binding domain-containing protein [Blastocatellia bacterium]|nr:LON peptidase substrate-binding domain-containing protein [Blastocatellia bacterium]